LGGFQNNLTVSPMSGFGAEFRQNAASNALTPPIPPHGHAHNFDSLRRPREKRSRADNFIACPSNQEQPLRVGTGNVIQVGVLAGIKCPPVFR
jgi:hypothetical protein